jgi:uncharacterized repeat protein (TIGR01451 family)
VRRIYASVLVLGILGLFGVGLMRGLAQTEAPALSPDQLKPATHTFQKPAAPAEPAAVKPDLKVPQPADLVIPVAPPEPLPAAVAPKADAPPIVAPPADPIKPAPKAPAVPVPDLQIPPVIPEPAPVMKEPAPVVPPMPVEPSATKVVEPAAPKAEPIAPPKAEPVASPVDADPVKPEVPFTNPMPNPAESLKTPPAAGRAVPSVSIETVAPETVPFGQPVSYEIVVKNLGAAPVTGVRVDEEFVGGAKLVSADPAGEASGDRVAWALGTLNAGDEKRIKVGVKPGPDGDLCTKPQLTYSSGSTLTVRVTRPNLVVEAKVPEAAQVGDEVPVQIVIKNTGTGEAGKVLLKAILTDGLKHPEGNDIQAVLNKLAPGESQTLTLRVQAAGPGGQSCSLAATAEGSAKAAALAKVDVRQPMLNLALAGPAKCVVKAEPTFTLEVANPGTSATEPVQVAAAFPEGLEFVSATEGGAYDATTRTVSWKLPPAAPGSKKPLAVKTKSAVAGHLAVRAVAQAGPKLGARAEAVLQAEGVPALLFEVVNLENPIEVGKETTYEIKLVNTGTVACTNVRISAALSDGLIPGAVSGTVPHKVVGQSLVFEPVAKLPVKGELVVRVRAKGTTPGDHRFKVQLSCDQLRQPVVKEESTSFYQP